MLPLDETKVIMIETIRLEKKNIQRKEDRYIEIMKIKNERMNERTSKRTN